MRVGLSGGQISSLGAVKDSAAHLREHQWAATPVLSERFIATSNFRVLRRPFESALNTPIRMVDQAGARPLRRDSHLQCCQRQVGTQVILHRPAHDPAAVKVQDGGQIEFWEPVVKSLELKID
jgi:hypothetical protein